MRILKYVLFVLLLPGIILFIPFGPTSVESLEYSCGDAVTSNYTMTGDLGPCSGHGLYVKSGVTLDCNGYQIIGLGNGSEQYGIYLYTDTTGATVKNCNVSGFKRGIRLRSAHNNTILNNETHYNGDFFSHIGYGIDIAGGSNGNIFDGNMVHNNADEGIHNGTGAHNNIFINNNVYDNYRENFYLLSSNYCQFYNNTFWGNASNSLYMKHSSYNVFNGNTFQDRKVTVRGDSHDNNFINNNIVNTGVRFQFYNKDGTVYYPRDNTIRGGEISGGSNCLSFNSSWGNMILDLIFSDCGNDIYSDGTMATSENTIIGTHFNPENVFLDSNSTIHVGWHLDVHVEDSTGNNIDDANVKAWDREGILVFNAYTSGGEESDGDIPTQDVLEYSQTASGKTYHTPHTLETIQTGYSPDSRSVEVVSNTSETVTLTEGVSSTATTTLRGTSGFASRPTKADWPQIQNDDQDYTKMRPNQYVYITGFDTNGHFQPIQKVEVCYQYYTSGKRKNDEFLLQHDLGDGNWVTDYTVSGVDPQEVYRCFDITASKEIWEWTDVQNIRVQAKGRKTKTADKFFYRGNQHYLHVTYIE